MSIIQMFLILFYTNIYKKCLGFPCTHNKQILFKHIMMILFNNVRIFIITKKLYRLIIDFFKDSLRISFKNNIINHISRLSTKSYIE
jgi:hypothetical protein